MEHTSTTTEQNESLGLYFHIPFCERKCGYCGFLSFISENPKATETYIDTLCKEIALYGQGQPVDTIFIGGGTPSLLTGSQVQKLLATVRTYFDVAANAEITLEGNPDSLREQNTEGYLSAGVNRFSMGVQSFSDESLKLLGRKHTSSQAVAAYEMLRKEGALNINLDLMFATPMQTPADWKQDLATAMTLNPEHLSFYGLQIEEGTPFYDAYRREEWDVAYPEEERAMYEMAFKKLTENDYRIYEISNAAKPGKECRHNLFKYWQMEPFLGMGPGASSFYRNRRYRNTDSYETWMQYLNKGALPVVCEGEEHRLDEETASALSQYKLPEKGVSLDRLPKEPLKDRMETYCIMALRTQDGILSTRFKELFGKDFAVAYEEILPTLQEYERLGWVRLSENRCRLTLSGISHSNEISGTFLRR